MSTKLVVVALLLSLSACKVGPNYKRPQASLPGGYQGAPPVSTPTAASPFGEMKWWEVFQDPALVSLIKEALNNNYDARIAASRVMQAGYVVGITRADQLPSVSAAGNISNVRNQLYPSNPTLGSANIQASYIVDFWGQYRRATEAARAELVATEYGQEVVRTTLVSGVAIAYFQLRQFDAQLDYARQTLEADREMLKLNTIRFKGGESAETDVLQAQLLVQQSEAQIISIQQGIEQTENSISVLLGRNPGPIARGTSLEQQPHIPEIPTGLPSALLQRRPDVRQAEESLVAANARVGVAKAAFFPQISLTGQAGVQSTSLADELKGPTRTWAVALDVVQPIYEGGRIRANYRLAWAQRDEAELTYKKAVLQALEDVSNNLVGYSQSRQYRIKLSEQTETYRQAAHLANVRFTGGTTAFLEVLVTEQQYLTSQLALAQAWNTELQNYVQLYRALGGGWGQ